MITLYKGESAVDFKFDLEDDLSGASATMKIKDQSGMERSLAGTVTDGPNGIFVYSLNGTEFSRVGIWKYWPVVVFSDGKKGIGCPREVSVLEEGAECNC